MSRRFIECDYGAHAISVCYETMTVSMVDVEKPIKKITDTYLIFWSIGRDKLIFRDKLRYCWQILKHGKPYEDMIRLNDESRRELIQVLEKIDKEK